MTRLIINLLSFLCMMCTRTHIGLIMLVRLSTHFNSKATGQVLMKFDVNIMPLEAIQYFYFLIPKISNKNMMDT
jgi:hypothetical protein